MSEGYVNHDLQNGVMTIEFYHPQSNSLPAAILQKLADTIQEAGTDENTRAIILRSGGEKVFCAGASFDELMQIKNEEEGLKFFSGFARVINSMRSCPKFIIGRIQGRCVGGGVGLAASTDYAIATQAAEVRLSELAIAIGPFVVGPVVERKIGTSAFSQLSIDASMWRSAEWARSKGLFAELHDGIDNMDKSISRLTTILSQSSPEAMAEMKKIFWKGTEDWDTLLYERAAISGQLVLSDYSREAINKQRKK